MSKDVPGRGISLPVFELGTPGSFFHVYLNPRVTFASVAIIWSFIAFTLSERWQAYKEFQMWMTWVTDEWCWLYILSQNIWIIILIYFLFCPKYANLKFGKEDDEPEFSNLQWFSMVFAAGVAVGLFFYGVAEPMWHFHDWGGSRFADMNDVERANHSLMVTYYHWGLHGWIPYCMIGATMSLMAYRRGLPLSMRSCLYPLWGKSIEGWKGDVVDVLSIVCTLFGVCTSLGLGVRQLNVGLIRLDRGTYAGQDLYGGDYDTSHNLPDRAFCSGADCKKGRYGIRYDSGSQSAIIAGVTFLATCSVVAGLKNGIARLSYIAFGMGNILLLAVLFMDDTMYILDALTTSFGYYLWYLPKISWETDAWARLNADHTWSSNTPAAGGITIEGDNWGGPDGEGSRSAGNWQTSWTIFYWGWWISWGPFVGTFLARISKGRTLGDFIKCTLICPTLYSVLWMGTFGAAGLNMQFKTLYNNDDWDCGFSSVKSTKLTDNGLHATHNQAYHVNLWCLSTEDVLFDQLGSYGSRELSYCLTGFAWIALLLYFITSSDSGSYVIDIIAANGMEDPPIPQRIFWAVTEGCAAIALIVGAGGDPNRSLRSLQAVSVVCGLPFTIVLMYVIHALWIAVKEEAGELDEDRKNFASTVVPNRPAPLGDVALFLRNAVCPVVAVRAVLAKIGDSLATFYSGLLFCLFYFAVTLLAMAPMEANLRMIAGSFYLAAMAVVTYSRQQTRKHLKIEHGDILTDACISEIGRASCRERV